MANGGTQSRDTPIALFIQIVSRQLQTLRGPPRPDPRRGAEPLHWDLIKVVRMQLGRGDAGAAWDGTNGFSQGRAGTLCPSLLLTHRGKTNADAWMQLHLRSSQEQSWVATGAGPAQPVRPCLATLFPRP